MNGAQSLIQSLVDSGVEVCFGNPGTSEMHFVAALDSVPRMRAVLGLFEGAVTGAADGYARIAGKPAATLLHLGPGMANGLANLHNARRAHTPIVNIVGDHATYHHGFDAPLESNIDALTEWLEGWSRRSESTATVGSDAADAVAASMDSPGRIATLVLPADVSWGEGGVLAEPRDIPPRAEASAAQIDSVVGALNAEGRATLLLGGAACSEAGLRAASRIAVATGAQILVETFRRGFNGAPGYRHSSAWGYFAEHATEQLRGTTQLVLAGAVSPVSFFAYPGKPSDLAPEGAAVTTLASVGDDVAGALEAVAELVAPGVEPLLQEANRPALPSGPLDVRNWADVIGALLPGDAIISDEAATSGWAIPIALAGAPRHDVLTLTGGAIGQGIPVATGAAVAAPERPVINLEADGSAMYTITALWTQAREQLNVTTILLNNRAYAILRGELQRVGAEGAGVVAQSMLDLSSPNMDYVKISEGLGVPASRASTAEELAEQFAAALAEPGPHLIEVMLPPRHDFASVIDRAFNWRFSVLAAIGLSLPLALGLLFVSMPMAVIVLVMVTAGAHRGAASFLLGWVLGISAVVAATIVIADYSFAESEASQTSVWSSVVRIVLGLVLFGLAYKQWRARPRDGSDPTVPKWMKSIDGLTPRKAFALAFLSAAVNPKNAALAVSGAATIAVATNVVAQQIVAAVVFTVIASVGIASPILVKVFSGKRADEILASAKAWMTANNAVMMAVILAILGATVLGEGLSGLQ